MSEYLPSALYCEGQGITYCEMLNHPIMCNFTHAGCIGDNIRLNSVYRVHIYTHKHTHAHTHTHTHTHAHTHTSHTQHCFWIQS